MKNINENRKKQKRRVYGYVRVSTEQQVRDGESIGRQASRIREWARLNDYELVGIEEDIASARKDKLMRRLPASCVEVCRLVRKRGAASVTKKTEISKSFWLGNCVGRVCRPDHAETGSRSRLASAGSTNTPVSGLPNLTR